MAYLGAFGTGRTTVSPAGDKLRLHVAKDRRRTRMLPPIETEASRRLREIQQMLLAASLTSGAVIAVAAVMMLRLF
ncbi:MAG TPA: hypothetical protein VL418_01235 [Devosiaceae bacterium]|nr:hypothetical protein [Devosiaceae bacterium]